MEAWLSTFRNGVFVLLAPEDNAQALEETLALLRPALCDAHGNWTTDYFGRSLRQCAGRAANMK
jgi:hypothetical protein